jgi:hypothetical protein
MSQLMNFALIEIIRYDNKIHNIDHKFALTEILDKYENSSKHRTQKKTTNPVETIF